MITKKKTIQYDNIIHVSVAHRLPTLQIRTPLQPDKTDALVFYRFNCGPNKKKITDKMLNSYDYSNELIKLIR